MSFRILQGRVLASNHRAREHILLSVPLFNCLAGGESEDGELCAWSRTRLSNVDGLMADPTGLNEDDLGEPVRFDSRQEAWQYLTDHFILIRSKEDYQAYFGKKTSIIDRKHFGTFHQRLGAELLLKEKIDPETWWFRQKFDPETGEVLENPYKFVQEAFLERYFDSLELSGRSVLDFGCGSGMAARRFTARGARVTGVDPDREQLERAVKKIGDGFTPIHLDLAGPEPLSSLPKGPFDFVWMSDVLLFYFYPVDAAEPIMTASALLAQLADRMTVKGRLTIMMPHGVFWLAPWLGSPDNPHTVLSEYSDRHYSVTPSLAEVAGAIHQAGLCIRQIHEPRPAESGRIVDPKAFHFASSFPLWWVFECVKSPR